MLNIMQLTAKKREITGSKVKKLRRQGRIPAVVYSKKIGSIPISLDQKEFGKIYKEAGESTLIDLKIEDGETYKTLISEIQIDPVSDEIIHTNLHQIDLKEKLTAAVPIELFGESPVVKSGAGILLTLIDEIEVECLPTNLPSEIKVDISELTEVDQGIQVKDLPVDRSKVEIKAEPEELVLKIEHPEMEEEEEKEVLTPEDVEIEREKEKEGGGEEKKPEEKEKKPEQKEDSPGKEEPKKSGKE
jgi:large subunit ribosomal protein L25